MNKKVAVLGAGPMGLVVAYELLKQGQEVVLFEADSVVGGMTASFDFEGVDIERYYHFICQSDEALFKLLRDLKIDNKLCWVKTKMGFYYQGKLFEWGSVSGLLKFQPLVFSDRIRYGIFALIAVLRKNWSDLDKIDAVSWIKRWIGVNAYDITWKSLFEQKFHHYTSNLSAAWIWARIHRLGISSMNGYLEGGSQTLLKALVKRIEEMGCEIRLNSPVKSIEYNHKLDIVYSQGKIEQFDVVVSTIPLPYITSIMSNMPPEFLDNYKNIDNIAVVCVIVKLNQRLTDNFWLNINDSRMDIPGIIEFTNLRPMDDHLVYVPYYMPDDHPMYKEHDEVFQKKVRSYFKMINPDFSDDAIVGMRVSRYRWAQPICPPAHLENLPSIRTNIPGVYIADTSFYYPVDRSISESAKLGKKIATMVVEDNAQK